MKGVYFAQVFRVFASFPVSDLVVVPHVAIERLLGSEPSAETAHDSFHHPLLGGSLFVVPLAFEEVTLFDPLLAKLAISTLPHVRSHNATSGISFVAMRALVFKLALSVLLEWAKPFLLFRESRTTTLPAS